MTGLLFSYENDVKTLEYTECQENMTYTQGITKIYIYLKHFPIYALHVQYIKMHA